MNCKQGDMAIIVKSWAGNEMKIITCLHLMPAGAEGCDEANGVRWKIDRVLEDSWGRDVTTYPDAWLQPLPGIGAEDVEPLLVAQAPSK